MPDAVVLPKLTQRKQNRLLDTFELLYTSPPCWLYWALPFSVSCRHPSYFIPSFVQGRKEVYTQIQTPRFCRLARDQTEMAWLRKLCSWNEKTKKPFQIHTLACINMSFDALGKFGEHLRRIRVALFEARAESNTSFLSALQTFRVP